MRLRGIDQTRINITLNGAPLNDMVDQGVFFSNFTDFGNSVESVQLQRGVGTSTNGTASYAGSINFESLRLQGAKPSAELQLVGGSFDTYRVSAEVFSGENDKNMSFYGRYTKTLSGGYKFNSGTNSDSYFFSGGYFGEKDVVKLTGFVGQTRNELAYLPVALQDIEIEPRTNYLDPNDEDDFGQQLVQLEYTRLFNQKMHLTSSVYYGGAGGDFPFTFDDGTGSLTQLNFYLKNDHVGFMSYLNYDNLDLNLTAGIHGYTFKRINEEATAPDFANPYYRDKTQKNEISAFAKASYELNKLTLYGDVQVRSVWLDFDPDVEFLMGSGVNPVPDIDARQWTFFNPKIGFTYRFNNLVGAIWLLWPEWERTYPHRHSGYNHNQCIQSVEHSERRRCEGRICE